MAGFGLDCRSDGRGLCRARRFRSGAGVIYLFAAKTNDERRQVLRAIGPVWMATKFGCSLPAAHSTLLSRGSMPRVLAILSALTIVLWLLILRGIGIEFRAHIENRMWQDFFDVVSADRAFCCGVFRSGTGNVVRGVHWIHRLFL